MKTIIISSFSQEAASKAKGEKLREYLEPPLKQGEDICVDFKGINKFASPFFNYSFASLAMIYGINEVKKIKLINISEIGKSTYNASMDNADMLSKNPDYIVTIEKIIQDVKKDTEE